MARVPRRLDDPNVRILMAEQNGAMHRRNLAAVEYVTDPDKRSVDWHWLNKWSARGVAQSVHARWSMRDRWSTRRAEFWKEVERRVFEARAEHIVVARLQELEKLVDARSYLDEYLQPLRDPASGRVRRYAADHELAGLPMLPLKLPSLDRFLKAYLELDKQIMTKRGEVKELRDPDVIEPVPDVADPFVDPAASTVSFSSDELRAMARVLVRTRQPELAAQPEVGILIEGVTAEEKRDEAESHGGGASWHGGGIQDDDRGSEPGGK